MSIAKRIFGIAILLSICLIGFSPAPSAMAADPMGYYVGTLKASADVPNNPASFSNTYGGVPQPTGFGCVGPFNDFDKTTYAIVIQPISQGGGWRYRFQLYAADNFTDCRAGNLQLVATEYRPIFLPEYHLSWNETADGHPVFINFDLVSVR